MGLILKSLSFTIAITLTSHDTNLVNALTLINFENGFIDSQAVNTVITTDNEVTFSIGSGTTGGTSPAFIAGVGSPLTAFTPNDGLGTVSEPLIGNFILTDQPIGMLNPPGLNYFIEFKNPVNSLSLDLLDYQDGGPNIGDTAILMAFSDTFLTPLTSDIFTITDNLPDGNLETLLVESANISIKSASLIFSAYDPGTAIDNIKFQTQAIPEPLSILGTFTALGFGTILKKTRRSKTN